MSDFDLPLSAELSGAALDRAYNARATVSVETFETIIGQYRATSDQAAATLPARLGLVYDDCGERLDIFAGGQGGDLRPAVIFIHGGYWRALSRLESRMLAPVLAAEGIACVVPDYTLSPQVSLREIVRQMRAAFTWLWQNAEAEGIDRERIYLCGSSAGGHLVGTLLSGGWQAVAGLPPTAVAGAMPISGLYDLDPISRTFPQEWLQLGPADIADLSPIRTIDGAHCPVVAAYAAHEAPGFSLNSRAYAAAWQAAGGAAEVLEVPGCNHFDVLLEFTRPDSLLSQRLLQMIARGR
ncbi:alpha/beta hydrolase [Pseudodonghicola flavimaris]|uniref:Alpha/beta hydrolase n=1 Tax=Pseudodonghicola flavimaris TaxID=3050036 RepID=A0ABT7F1J0_9RHOB|nr:alpha/beta hydrolase [Pseudodonghicola flavimaris]MDK3018329.1 alpha/beta hydrolase [Pseudodonghicola flavimaris]